MTTPLPPRPVHDVAPGELALVLPHRIVYTNGTAVRVESPRLMLMEVEEVGDLQEDGTTRLVVGTPFNDAYDLPGQEVARIESHKATHVFRMDYELPIPDPTQGEDVTKEVTAETLAGGLCAYLQGTVNTPNDFVRLKGTVAQFRYANDVRDQKFRLLRHFTIVMLPWYTSQRVMDRKMTPPEAEKWAEGVKAQIKGLFYGSKAPTSAGWWLDRKSWGVKEFLDPNTPAPENVFNPNPARRAALLREVPTPRAGSAAMRR